MYLQGADTSVDDGEGKSSDKTKESTTKVFGANTPLVSCYFDSRFFNNSFLINHVCVSLVSNRIIIVCVLHLGLYTFCYNYYLILDWALFRLLKEKLVSHFDISVYCHADVFKTCMGQEF